ncbi:MAG: type II toxin-antitoxin system Phd/YefM family antitoxin [Candidatus Omnitrophica bacterium]|nr:type II toxin-antitoxin system Phd/YefM family antitoxin [Candidatus Omnitrophota bacterium]
MDYIVPISEARAHLPELAQKISKIGKHCVITKNGKAKVILVSPEELETLEILADRKLIRALVRAEEDIKAARIFSHKEVFGDV